MIIKPDIMCNVIMFSVLAATYKNSMYATVNYMTLSHQL